MSPAQAIGLVSQGKYWEKEQQDKMNRVVFGRTVQQYLDGTEPIPDAVGRHAILEYTKLLPKAAQESFQEYAHRKLAQKQPTENNGSPAAPPVAAPTGPMASGPPTATPASVPPVATPVGTMGAMAAGPQAVSATNSGFGDLTPPPVSSPVPAIPQAPIPEQKGGIHAVGRSVKEFFAPWLYKERMANQADLKALYGHIVSDPNAPPTAVNFAAQELAAGVPQGSPARFQQFLRQQQAAGGGGVRMTPEQTQAILLMRVKSLTDQGLTPEAAINYLGGHPAQYAPRNVLKPGEELRDEQGRVLGTGQPRFESVSPGAQGVLIPNTGAMATGPGMTPSTAPTVIASPPQLLTDTARNAMEWYASKTGRKVEDVPRSEMAKAVAEYKDATMSDADREAAEARKATVASLMGLRQVQMENAQHSRGDMSYRAADRTLTTLSTPITQLLGRVGRLQDTLAQNTPQADALVAPELLTVMAGGQGSGLRMNEAEIARIVNGRSNWEKLKAAINKWQADPKAARSITPSQQQQIRGLVNEVARKLNIKQEAINAAYQAIGGSEDPAVHRQAMTDLRTKLADVDKGAMESAPPGRIRVRRKSDGAAGTISAEKFDPNVYEKM